MFATIKQQKNGALQVTIYQWLNNVHYEKNAGWENGVFYSASLLCLYFYFNIYLFFVYFLNLFFDFLLFWFLWFIFQKHAFYKVCNWFICFLIKVNLLWKGKNVNQKMKRAFSLNQKAFFMTFKFFLLQKYVTTENPSFKVNVFCSSFKVTIFEKMVLIQKLSSKKQLLLYVSSKNN